MKSKSNTNIILLVLVILLPAIAVYLKYNIFNRNLPEFSLMGIGAKSLVIILVFLAGYLYARSLNRDAEIRPLFRTMFIMVLAGEISIATMDYLCMFHLFPDFVQTFYEHNKVWLKEHSHWPEERQKEALQDILNLKTVRFQDILQSFLRSIITSSIFAIIFAFIIKGYHNKNLRLRNWQSGLNQQAS